MYLRSRSRENTLVLPCPHATKPAPQVPRDLAPYTGLTSEQQQQWEDDPRAFINELLRQTLSDVKQVQAAPCIAPVQGIDKVKAAVKGGTIGFSVSFMLAKAWVNLWGLLATLAKGNAQTFFLIGAGGYAIIASLSHATLAKVAGFAPGANYGGPQAPDRDAFHNYITLLGMWYVAMGDEDREQADRIAQALQEVVDGVIARAQQHDAAGQPLSFDFRDHPILGSWFRNGHFHLAFFSYSALYLLSGGFAPWLREALMKMPASVAERAGLYALCDFLAAAACGQLAGILTLAGHMLGNSHIQRGPDRPGLHHSWPQELDAARTRLSHLNAGAAELALIRSRLVDGIATAPMSEEERTHCQRMLQQRVLPWIDEAIDRLEGQQTKWLKRKKLLTTPEGRDEIASRKAGALAFKGAGKTAHKLINGSPHAQGLRSASEAVGNLPSLLPMAYALMVMYGLFATFMPFDEHAPSPMPMNGTVPPAEFPSGGGNHTLGATGTPGPVEEWSLAIGWILITGFSGIRPFSIPGTELLFSLILAAALKVGHWTGLRRPNPKPPGPADLPPPPERSADHVVRIEVDSDEDPAAPQHGNESADYGSLRSVHDAIDRPDEVVFMEGQDVHRSRHADDNGASLQASWEASPPDSAADDSDTVSGGDSRTPSDTDDDAARPPTPARPLPTPLRREGRLVDTGQGAT